jgi:aminoglycoside 3-N-acetyltransferase
VSETDAVARTGSQPITTETLTRDLTTLGLQPGMTVLVHSSLSQLGWVCGGPVAVVLALETALGPTGTLVMPTHSGDLSNPALWQHPPVPEAWWSIIRDTMPAYDPDLTPTRGMGAVVECFRRQTGVVRSAHPQTSFAARGPNARLITTDQALDNCLGEGSPLARLYDLDAWVLLLGVGHSNNTSLHLAEYRADYPGKKSIAQGCPVQVNGTRQWVAIADIDLSDEDFPKLGEAFAATGQVRRGPVGVGEGQFMRQRALVDFGVEWMHNNRR